MVKMDVFPPMPSASVKNCRQAEPGVFDQHANTVTKVLKEGVHAREL